MTFGYDGEGERGGGGASRDVRSKEEREGEETGGEGKDAFCLLAV